MSTMNGTSSTRPPLLIFDVDGTLTTARLRISPEMTESLKAARAKGVKLGVVSGSDLPKVVEQLGDSLEEVQSLFDYVFFENGLVGYKGTEAFPSASISQELGEKDLQRLINWVLGYFSRLELPCKRGNFVEFRKGMLNFCPVGRSCTYDERLQFAAYDQKHGIRTKLVEELRREFADLKLEFAIGGQISVDVYPIGWDKTYCLRYLEKDFDVIHFFGDKTAPGGNDHAIFEDARTIGHTVTSLEDTRAQIEAVINDSA